MAILASGRIGERAWEVRSAGGTRRLTIDGVLHTEWNPSRPLTGSVWDPLALAAFAGPRLPRDVLLLGLGGGAAVHLLRRHVRPERIVAVERDSGVADIARKWFDVAGPDLRIAAGDAKRWVREHARRFDLVIDDVFGESSGEPLRSAEGARWWRLLASRLAPDGVLVVNFAESRDLARSALVRDPWFARRFPGALRFTFADYHNAIVALGPEACSPSVFRHRLGLRTDFRVSAVRR